MTLISPITEITIAGVFDRGVPNQERVVFRTTQRVATAHFAVIVGVNTSVGAIPRIAPYGDYFFWFGDAIIERDEWIFLYTGPGTPRKTTVSGTKEVAYVVHWNKATTLFADSRVLPALIRVGEILIAAPPANFSQLALTHAKG